MSFRNGLTECQTCNGRGTLGDGLNCPACGGTGSMPSAGGGYGYDYDYEEWRFKRDCEKQKAMRISEHPDLYPGCLRVKNGKDCDEGTGRGRIVELRHRAERWQCPFDGNGYDKDRREMGWVVNSFVERGKGVWLGTDEWILEYTDPFEPKPLERDLPDSVLSYLRSAAGDKKDYVHLTLMDPSDWTTVKYHGLLALRTEVHLPLSSSWQQITSAGREALARADKGGA